MDKRMGLALAISVVILVGWWKLFPQPQQQATPPAAPAASTTAGSTSAGSGATSVGATGGAVAPASAPEQRITLDTPDARFVLSSWGGTLRAVDVKEAKFREKKPGQPDRDLQIVRTATPETAPLVTTFDSSDFGVGATTPFAVSQPAPNAVVFTADVAGVIVEKRYTAEPGRYQLRLEVHVTNKRDKAINEGLVLHLFGRQDPEKKGGSFLSYASANLTEMVCSVVGKKPERFNIDTLLKGDKTASDGTIQWMAADEKFFTVAVAPHPDTIANGQKCFAKALDALTGEVLIPFLKRPINANETASYAFTVFGGPKYREALEAVTFDGHDANLGDAVGSTYTIISVISKPLLGLLKFFYRFTGNWGVAIILLTIFVRLVTFYPQFRTMTSAKKMQKLAPKLAAIRKKFENDKQRQGMETMNLYKAHGVSPLGGCLPALIQMPIWMALFSTLNYAVELHRSGFIFYIHDLSAADPYWITPLLMGVVMFLQMRMSPAGADPQQQKMMSIMMPIMFTVFSLFLPAGLAIYTLTSYLIGILQQLFVNYIDKRRDGVPAKA